MVWQYYWYNTEPGKDYQQTMLDVKAYHVAAGVPVGWYELVSARMFAGAMPLRPECHTWASLRVFAWQDSWWYVKDTSTGEVGGVKLWEAKPDVFPAGMAWMAQQLNTPLAAHNK